MGSETSVPLTRLARRLSELREGAWPRVAITQGQLGEAFRPSRPLNVSNFSSWETGKSVPADRWLSAYAAFKPPQALCGSRTVLPYYTVNIV